MNTRFNLKASEHLHSHEAKKHFNLEHFTEAAQHYDMATRCLSFWRDSSWKRELVGLIDCDESGFIVDVACGTGDICFLTANSFPHSRIMGIDLTPEMIDIASRRNRFDNVSFECGDMCSIPLPDNSVDAITGSYAIRNAPDLEVAIQEFKRVLKPGATMYFLDFSKAGTKTGRILQYWLLKFWGSLWGMVFHGNPQVHGYISESLLRFPCNRELEDLFLQNGLKINQSRRLFGGMMRLHVLKNS